MKRIYIVDANEQMASYCCGEFFMDDSGAYDAIAVTDMLAIGQTVDPEGDAMLIANVTCLPYLTEDIRQAMQGRIAVYADDLESEDAALTCGLPSYGCTPSARALYKAILGNKFASPKVARPAPPQPTVAAPAPASGDVWNPDTAPVAEPEDEPRLPEEDVSLFGRADNWSLPTSLRAGGHARASSMAANAPAAHVQPAADAASATHARQVNATPAQRPAAPATEGRADRHAGAGAYGDVPRAPRAMHGEAVPAGGADAMRDAPKPGRPAEPAQATPHGGGMREQFARMRKEEADRLADERIRKDIERGQGARGKGEPATAIVVTAGKGGVGKTTIATSLALLLARTESGRGLSDVCIIDNNADFGNVMGTLALSQDGPTSAHWATDITERVARGMSTEYTREDMDSYLRVHEASGLHVLCAPATNIDSFLIDDQALSIMLHNIVDNGGFDYVVIDTGNNTRDSTYRSIKIAQHVFLVFTQDVNAVMSDIDFFNSFAALREDGKPMVDMNKFSIVLNMRRPGREVGMPVSEALTFIAEHTKPYDLSCIAEIDYAKAVPAANNLGEAPFVLSNPSHPFSVAIGQLARHVHREDFVLSPIRQKGFLARLKAKFGR